MKTHNEIKKTLKNGLKNKPNFQKNKKFVLKRIITKGVKVKPHNVNELNTSVETNFTQVYDLKDHTPQAKRRDLLIWLISASIIFFRAV